MVEKLNRISWDDQGLVPVIVQDHETQKVLMFAWMNREALQKTMELRQAVYFSRSRRKLWFKGEESGHFQHVREIRLDCDGDVIIYSIDQEGGIACHTGRESCFFRVLRNGAWEASFPVVASVFGPCSRRSAPFCSSA